MSESHTVNVFLPGVLGLLTESLYTDPAVAVRECLQNAYDAILRRWAEDASFDPHIHLSLDPQARTLTFHDNGAGLTERQIHDYLATVGQSLTRQVSARKQETPYPLIGRFGLGLLSAFTVADRVEVTTRSHSAKQAWRWVSKGDDTYTLARADPRPPGTDVRLHLNDAGAFLLNPGALKEAVRTFADLLPVPITLDGEEAPLNTMAAPWHNPDATETDYYEYIVGQTHAEPYFVLPLPDFRELGYDLHGVLYIPSGAVLSVNEFGRAKVFVRRMFVTDDEAGLLPRWARFVSAIVESDDLELVANREGLRHTEAYYAIQRRLEFYLLDVFRKLAHDHQSVWAAVVREHNDLIVGWAVESPQLFDAVSNLVTFRTNMGRMTLAAYSSHSKALYYTVDENITRSMAIVSSVQGVPVIDAGRFAEEEFLRLYAYYNQREAVLLDEAPATLFDVVNPQEGAWGFIRSYFQQQGLRVTFAEFAPRDLPAVFIVPTPNEDLRAVQEALESGDYGDGLTFFMEELLKRYQYQPENTPLLMLNVTNGLLKRLAALPPESEAFTAALEVILHSTQLWAQGVQSLEAMQKSYSMLSYSLERLLK